MNPKRLPADGTDGPGGWALNYQRSASNNHMPTRAGWAIFAWPPGRRAGQADLTP